MRLIFIFCCLTVSVSSFAQSLFDENAVSADEVREMIIEIFSSEETKAFKQSEMQSGRGVLLLLNFEPGARRRDNIDVENALTAIVNGRNLIADVPIEFADESSIVSSRGEEFEKATRMFFGRDENLLNYTFRLNDRPNRKMHSLSVVFEKDNGDWQFLTQKIDVVPWN